MVHEQKQDEKEELYEHIRGLHATKGTEQTEEERYDLDCLEWGKLIATGCNAAVYEARMLSAGNSPVPDHASEVREDKSDSDISVIDEDEDVESNFSDSDISVVEDDCIENLECEICMSESDVEAAEERSHGTAGDEESLSFNIIEDEAGVVDGNRSVKIIEEELISAMIEDEGSLSDISLLEDDPESDDSAICDPGTGSRGDNCLSDLIFNLVPVDPGGASRETAGTRETTLDDYDLAVKMMFNYDAESNAEAILQAMHKELVPLTCAVNHLQTDQWRNGNHVKKKAWSPHPNIVRMYGQFVDAVPDVPDNVEHYPAALPPRISQEGLGRNMTLFLVMKRYSCTLSDYLAKENPSMDTRCLLLCQLLEGVAFLRQQLVAHRDLKSDNLLIDLSGDPEWPRLVISDFGCCLNEGTLQIPYVTSEINKGGNSALMAPEIACVSAGRDSVLDYSKSDMWAVGALIYELMGCPNPFYRSKARPTRLDSRTYRKEELPPLPDEVPEVVRKLTQNLLSRDSSQRLSGAVAATVMQLYMRSLSKPNNNSNNNNSNNNNSSSSSHEEMKDIQNWAVNNAANTILARLHSHTNSSVPSDIKQAFFSRISHHDLETALQFMQTV